MATRTVFIHNNDTNEIESYTLDTSDPMPYNEGNTLTVSEMQSDTSISSVIISDKMTMEAWNCFRQIYGNPIYVPFAFKRIWEGGHSNTSQHYAGKAFDVGQNLTDEERAAMRALAESSGCWSYIEPEYLTDTWVHFDKRHGIAACSPYVGYPVVKKGDRGVYVFVLQDALNALGFTGGGFDGIFGTGTENALKSFQVSNGLTVDGIAGCNTWSELASQAKGIGKTSTVVLP